MSHPAPAPPMAYEEKHLELLAAAARLFAARGFHDTSVRELAQATGRSLSGLYYYFTTKEELLYQIQHHCYSTLLAAAERTTAEATGPRQKLLVFVSGHLAFFRHNMNEMKVLAHEDLTLGGDYGERILDLKRKYSKLLIDILVELDRELPSQPRRPSPEIAAFLLFGSMNWLYTWPRRLRELPAEELASAVAQTFLCGFTGCAPLAFARIQEGISCEPSAFWTRGRGVKPGASARKTEKGDAPS